MGNAMRLQILLVVAVVFGTSFSGLTAYADQKMRVFILPDAYTDGTDALVKSLESAGHKVVLSPVVEFLWDDTNPRLADFDAVIHLNGATYQTPLSIEAQLALVEFVQNGGNFIGGQFNGFEQANKQQIDMPDLVLQTWPSSDNCSECYMTWDLVPGQRKHPVLKGIPDSFTFFADAHDDGLLVEFPVEPSVVLMTTPGGGPAVTVREFGKGRIVNFSFATNTSTYLTLQDPVIQQLYINAVSWNGHTPEESVDHLIEAVRELVHGGSLKPIQGYFLVIRLKIARRELDNGRPRAAVFLLEKFSYHVEDIIEEGELAVSEGQPLIDAAQGIIEDLKE